MSDHEKQIDDEKAICPYCGTHWQVEAEDYDEAEREIECDECGKLYWLHDSFSVTHYTRPDCRLNGQSHKWELMTFSGGGKAFFCATCNECSLVSDDGTPEAEKTYV